MLSSTHTWVMVLLAVAVGGLTVIPVYAQDGAPTTTLPLVTTIPSDGFNMKVVEQPTPYYVITKLDPPVFNWFAGTFTNLPTDKEVTIGLNMNGMDHPLNIASVSKWVGLIPVMTYADPMQYETYEWFRKDDQGRWVSGDPFKTGDDQYAGTGKVPIQHCIPEAIADQFLSADGKYWQPWREIETAEAVVNLNIFRMKQRFALSTVTIAMRIPYTYTYQQELLRRLRLASIPGVSIDEIGITPEGRVLQAIHFKTTEKTIAKPITVMIVAREHATEHASSWVAEGVINNVLTAQNDTNVLAIEWIVIPIEDPDGSAHSRFDQLTDKFFEADEYKCSKEVLS